MFEFRRRASGRCSMLGVKRPTRVPHAVADDQPVRPETKRVRLATGSEPDILDRGSTEVHDAGQARSRPTGTGVGDLHA